MNATLLHFLKHKAYAMRVSSVVQTTAAGSGHVTSALSCADLVAALFFYAMRADFKNPHNPNNDRFILSKGHAVPIVYAAYKELGLLSEQELLAYRSFDSVLEGHPTPRFPYIEVATGSLGQGLSIGVGMNLSARLDKQTFRTYVLMGDGEVAEGSVWEATELASYYNLDHLTALIDVNRLGQTDQTLEGYHLEDFAQKFSAFGWQPFIIDGHDMAAIVTTLDAIKSVQKPAVIIARTVKGYGVETVENKNGFHGRAFSKQELPAVLEQLQHRFVEDSYDSAYAWQPPHVPDERVKKDDNNGDRVLNDGRSVQPPYTKDQSVATRYAYGQALAALGCKHPALVSLDAEVKNSTFAQLFEQEHAERFFQCFVAEQNMVGMGVGFAARGKIPFLSTFACFFTRAFDQIRMASIGRSPLRLVGSHAGVSVGQDGPSQMGLEDIAMMNAVPHSVIVYPCDAVSTWKLVEQMVAYQDGISYMRTTRGATPVLYDTHEQFPLGRCKVVRQSEEDVICVVAAGITLFEALTAYEQLKKEGIAIAVIDLYSIKPFDTTTVLRMARKAHKRLITVEDHYVQGGIGQIVAAALCNAGIQIELLAVTKLPCSGTAQALMAYEAINAAAIIKKVKAMLGAHS
jgi:transketolase